MVVTSWGHPAWLAHSDEVTFAHPKFFQCFKIKLMLVDWCIVLPVVRNDLHVFFVGVGETATCSLVRITFSVETRWDHLEFKSGSQSSTIIHDKHNNHNHSQSSIITTTITIIRSWTRADWYLAIHASSPGSGPGRYARLSLTIYPYHQQYSCQIRCIHHQYWYQLSLWNGIVVISFSFGWFSSSYSLMQDFHKIPQSAWLSVFLPVRGSGLPDDFKWKRGCWVVGRLVGVVYRSSTTLLLLLLLPGGLDVKLLQLLSLGSPALCRWRSVLWGLWLRRVSTFPFFLVAFCFVAIFRFYVNCRYWGIIAILTLYLCFYSGLCFSSSLRWGEGWPDWKAKYSELEMGEILNKKEEYFWKMFTLGALWRQPHCQRRGIQSSGSSSTTWILFACELYNLVWSVQVS